MFRRSKKGFTLVELLVVIAIIGILIGLLLPAVQRARAAARKIKCANKMRNWSLAVLNYESSKGQLPGSQELMKRDVANRPYMPVTWMGAVLEHIERSDLIEAAISGQTLGGADLYLDIAVCPEWPNTSKGRAWNSYVANAGGIADRTQVPTNGLFLDRIRQGAFGGIYPANVRVTSGDLRDGSSHTIMLAENIQAGAWNQVGSLNPSATSMPIFYPGNNSGNPDATSSVPKRGRFYTTFVWHVAKEKNKAGNFPIVNPVMKINGKSRTLRMGGGPPNNRAARPSSFHSSGVNVFFADNSGLFLSDMIEYHVYQQLMTPYGAQSGSPFGREVLREGDYLR